MSSLPGKKNLPLKSFLRIALISGGAFIALIIITLLLASLFFSDNIKNGFVKHINARITTEIMVEDISVNLLRHFPQASITFTGVTIKENLPDIITQRSKEDLLKAERIYFRFPLIDFFRKNYTITKIELKNVDAHMKILKEGANYLLWKNNGNDSTENNFSFQMKSFQLSNVRYRLTNHSKGYFLDIIFQDAEIKGDFANQDYKLEASGTSQLEKLSIDDVEMIGGQKFNFDFGFDVLKNAVFTINQGRFSLDDLHFSAEGIIDNQEEPLYLDLAISGDDIRFESLLNSLPDKLAQNFTNFRSKGQLTFDAFINGHFSPVVNPFIKASFALESGEVSDRKSDTRLKEIFLEGSFENGMQRNMLSSVILINNLSAVSQSGSIKLNGKISNLYRPAVHLNLFADMNPKEWINLINVDTLENIDGDALVDIEFNGRIGSAKNESVFRKLTRGNLKGVITANNLNFNFRESPLEYRNINLTMNFNNDNVWVKNFSGNVSTTDFKVSGYFSNFLPWLYSNDEKLLMDARLKAGFMNFDELLQDASSDTDSMYRLKIPQRIVFEVNASVDSMQFRKFNARDISGTFSLSNQMFYADQISMQTMNGSISAKGYINGQNPDYLTLGSEANIEGVDVNQLFYQMGNFGQSGIEDENLEGTITANANFVSRWSPSLEIDWESLETTANVRVENGELIDYKPMLALSRYIRVSDLKRVRFSTLENQIRIKNQTIYIPDMQINSNAINIRISGEHNFNNEIQYRLQVLLSDLLARENRQNRNSNEELGYIVDDGLGRTTLFLLVTGNIDDPVFKYDRRAAQEKIKEDFIRERQNLKNALRREFTGENFDTLPDGTLANPSERQKEEMEMRQREEGEFIIEWDED